MVKRWMRQGGRSKAHEGKKQDMVLCGYGAYGYNGCSSGLWGSGDRVVTGGCYRRYGQS